MPASSPARKSICWTSKLFDAAHLEYILNSMLTQSQDSVPPAPEFIDSMALFLSSGLPNNALNSSASSLPSSPFISSLRCSMDSLSPSSIISKSSFISLRPPSISAHGSTTILKALRSFIVSLAFLVSSQNLGVEISLSSSLTFFCFISMSKMPP